MPNVTAAPRGHSNGQVITEFVDSVGTDSVTYTYPTAQEKLWVRNTGLSPITVTVGANTQTIQRGERKEIEAEFTSFSIASSGGVQSFEATADEKGSVFDTPEGRYFSTLSVGGGAMLKSVYDTDGNGVVDQAAKLQTARTITLTGGVAGSASFDGSTDITITTTGGGSVVGVNVMDYGARTDGVDSYTGIQAAITAIGAFPAKLILPTGTYIIGTNITLPSNIFIEFTHGAILSPNAAKTVIIAGEMNADVMSRRFAGPGTVLLTTNKNILFPQWWGAVGDGTTNDLPAFQAMVTSIDKTKGATIFIPRTATHYSLTTTTAGIRFISYNNITIKSDGAWLKPPSTVPDTDSGAAYPNFGKCSILQFALCNNVVVDGLNFHGNVALRTVMASESHNDNLHIASCENVIIQNVQSKESMTDGLYVGTWSGAVPSKNIKVYDSIFTYCRRNNISVTSVDLCVIEKCVVDYAGLDSIQGIAPRAGIDVEPNATTACNNVYILNNTVRYNEYYGIIRAGVAGSMVTNMVVEGNYVANNGTAGTSTDGTTGGGGIYFQGVAGQRGMKIVNNHVIDNTLTGTTCYGIRINGDVCQIISGNHIINANIGLALTGIASYASISDNYIKDCNLGAIYGDVNFPVKFAKITDNTIINCGNRKAIDVYTGDVDSFVVVSDNVIQTLPGAAATMQGIFHAGTGVAIANDNVMKKITGAAVTGFTANNNISFAS